jgi:hypothetical protein
MGYEISAEKILERMARRIAQVGLYEGIPMDTMSQGSESRPCTMLGAFHFARAACRSKSMRHDGTWDAYHAAHDEARRRLADALKGAPVVAPEGWSIGAYLDSVINVWGESHTAAEAVTAVRSAAGLATDIPAGQQDTLFDIASPEMEPHVEAETVPPPPSASRRRRRVVDVHLPA